MFKKGRSDRLLRSNVLAAAVNAALSAALWVLLAVAPEQVGRAWWWFLGFGQIGAWTAFVCAVAVLVAVSFRAIDRPTFLGSWAFLVVQLVTGGATLLTLVVSVVPGGVAAGWLLVLTALVCVLITLVRSLWPNATGRTHRRARHRALRLSGQLASRRRRVVLAISGTLAVVGVAVALVQLTPVDRGVCTADGAFMSGDYALIYTDCGTFRMPVERYAEMPKPHVHIVTRGFDLAMPWSLTPVAVELTVLDR